MKEIKNKYTRRLRGLEKAKAFKPKRKRRVFLKPTPRIKKFNILKE
tara:strand:- start:768 stop:905 length:138 start_codon:yes stop_codon:yes gene_type:complete